MNRVFLSGCSVVFVLCLVTSRSTAQISIDNLHELQSGKVPVQDSTSLSTAYNQFNINYTAGGVQAGVRAEVYRASVNGRSITYLSQRYLRWSHGPTYMVAGNYYAILGRGLTLRAFELPGVILEGATFRRRYAPTEDLEGAMGSWSFERVEAKALFGRPVLGDIPPDVPGIERRKDWVAGGELAVRPLPSVLIGGTAVNLRPKTERFIVGTDTSVVGDNSWAWSWLAGLDLQPAFSRFGLDGVYGEVYAEFAQRARDDRPGHGRYLSGNLGIGQFGLSVEYKDYENFELLSNDPPQLVREHSAYLLNRNTHVMEPSRETGYQVEAVYALGDWMTITGNVSQATNRLSSRIVLGFDERYIGLDFHGFGPRHSAQIFFDWGKDELDARLAIRTGGVLLGRTFANDHSVELDLEIQRGEGIPLGEDPWYWDSYAAMSWQMPIPLIEAGAMTAAISMDRSTDIRETDVASTLRVFETDPVTFWSMNLSTRYSRYEALLFAGERRGGTACTSGTCYQVLPFRGVELRLKTRF
jgi:hypothetical protein